MNDTRCSSQFGQHQRRGAATDIPADPQPDFDPGIWAALIEEQKQLIAAAAGVDASKVSIRIGH